MEKNKVYFGEQGITSTSANNYANKAKEYVKKLTKELENIEFYSTFVNVIGNNASNSECLRDGQHKDYLDSLEDKIKDIAEANSLIAWLREAIKAKEEISNELKVFSFDQYIEKFDIKEPEIPVRQKPITEDEYLSNMSVKERNEFFELQAFCSTYGQLIHPDGSFAKARNSFFEIKSKPKKLMGNDSNALIYTYVPTVSDEDVDGMFFKLNAKYTDYQSRLNKIKYSIDTAIKNSVIDVEKKYKLELEEYQRQEVKLRVDYNEYIATERKNAVKLRIVIPDKLKPILEKLKNI